MRLRTLAFSLPLLLLLALPARAQQKTLPIEIDLPGIRCSACLSGVHDRIMRFKDVVKVDVSAEKQRAFIQVLPSFEQYVALEHTVEDAGGAIHMFHPKYRVPQQHFIVLGVKDHDVDKIEDMTRRMQSVKGVRQAIIDPLRWFTNEKGIDVGGAVIFTDPNPQLELDLVKQGKEAGFIVEMQHHGHTETNAQGIEEDKWSEMNHGVAGLCLMALAVLGMLQIGLSNPPPAVRYGSVAIWLVMFVFLFIRSDPECWPIGPLGWVESWRDWEVAQHRIALSLLLLVALGDYMRIKKGWTLNPSIGRWGMLAIGLLGSGLLFTHLHRSLDPAHASAVFRMNAQHMAMATTALLFAVTKFTWDTWQVPKRHGQYLWLVFLGLMGLVLNLYVE